MITNAVACKGNLSVQQAVCFLCLCWQESWVEPGFLDSVVSGQIRLLDLSVDEGFCVVLEHLGKEKLCVGSSLAPVHAGSDAPGLRHAKFLTRCVSLCSTRSAQNAPARMMATRSHPIPCLLSATKGNTDPLQTIRREGLGQRVQ